MRTERKRLLATKDLLPAGYSKLEYIHGGGKAFIDTGLMPKSTFRYEIKANISASSANIIGADTTTGSYYLRQFSLWFYFCVGSKTQGGLKYGVDWMSYPYDIQAGNFYVETNGKRLSSAAFGEDMNGVVITSNLKLFTGWNPIGEMWFAKIWDGGKLVRDYVPAMRKSDNVVGMYDRCEGKFYSSGSTAQAFTGGVVLKAIFSSFLEPSMAERRVA